MLVHLINEIVCVNSKEKANVQKLFAKLNAAGITWDNANIKLWCYIVYRKYRAHRNSNALLCSTIRTDMLMHEIHTCFILALGHHTPQVSVCAFRCEHISSAALVTIEYVQDLTFHKNGLLGTQCVYVLYTVHIYSLKYGFFSFCIPSGAQL